MKNKRLLLGAILAIIFVLYNVVIFTFADTSTATFWSAYIFTIVSFLLQIGVFWFLYSRKALPSAIHLGIPLTVIGIIYLIIQIVAGASFMCTSGISLKISNVTQAVILGVYLIISVAALLGKTTIEDRREIVNGKVMFLQLLQDEVVTMQTDTIDSSVAARLSELAELIRFSDPMSHPSLALLEQKIGNALAELSNKIKDNDIDSANKLCNEVERLLGERNRKCKILKAR